MMIDVARARRETPGCNEVLHFNNAGASLTPSPVSNAVRTYLDLESRIDGYEAAAAAADRVERVYSSAAALLNCATDEIAIVDSATRAWDMAFYSMPFEEGDRILTSIAEYASNYIAFLQVARRTGAVVEAVPNDGYGRLSVPDLEEMIDDRVRLISITHVPTNGGLINPAAEVGRVANAAGIPYLLDACQSIGQMPLDVDEIGCDLLSATSRKYLRGPRGMGLLYVSEALLGELEPPFLDLHSATWTAADEFVIRPDARRFESWESNIAAKVGFGAAIDYAMEWGLAGIQHWVGTLADLLRDNLDAMPGVVVRDLGVDRCGIVTFETDDTPAQAVSDALSERAVNVAVTSAAATRLDMEGRGLDQLVRASVHYYNTEAEIARFCEQLALVLAA